MIHKSIFCFYLDNNFTPQKYLFEHLPNSCPYPVKRERERERERGRGGETDRERERQTDRQRESKRAKRESDRHSEYTIYMYFGNFITQYMLTQN